jgi:predicted amidohydrolase YtcJ
MSGLPIRDDKPAQRRGQPRFSLRGCSLVGQLSLSPIRRSGDAMGAQTEHGGSADRRRFRPTRPFMALQRCASTPLKLRVTSIPVELLTQAHDLGCVPGWYDLLRIGSVKVFMDGALGPRTVAMFEPYDGEPGNKGILNVDDEQLFELGRTAADVGLAMAVHAIGDRANHEALQAFEHLRAHEGARHLPRLRHRIEHVQVIHPDDLGRLARLDVIASMQPVHATSDMHMADTYWGSRTAGMHGKPAAGERPCCLCSDAPVESPNLQIHAAVTRRRPDGPWLSWH